MGWRKAGWAGVILTVIGCTKERPEAALSERVAEASPAKPVVGRFLERGGPGRLRYLGLDHDPVARGGAALSLTHFFEVEVPFSTDPEVFVHLESSAQGRLAVDDHPPVRGLVPLSRMKAGERWRDRHQVEIPSTAKSGTLTVFFGLFRGNLRMTLETEPGQSDGRDRLRVATLPVEGAPDPELPLVTVARASGPIEPDGVLEEPDWSKAQVMKLSDTLGRDRPIRFPTRVRLLYDEAFLYVGFEAEDRDVSERYSRRDDPIYEHEAVELFLMAGVAAPDLGPYVELQASPTGVIFDASFTGRRQGMNTRYDAGQVVGTTRHGTLNDDRPDQRWVSEWKVPFGRIRGVDRSPDPGDEWRMNAFRIEKFKEDGELRGEYTAWSPPRVGDFHATDRFGRMVFGGAER